MGYITRYDTHYNDETGEWLEKIGFCYDEDDCSFCDAYKADGSPETAFVAIKNIDKENLDKFPW